MNLPLWMVQKAHILSPVKAACVTSGPRTWLGEKGHHGSGSLGREWTYGRTRKLFAMDTLRVGRGEERMWFDWKGTAGAAWVGMWSWPVRWQAQPRGRVRATQEVQEEGPNPGWIAGAEVIVAIS